MKQLSSPIDLIKKSFEIFFKKENFIYFVKIYSVLLPSVIFQFFLGSLFDPQTSLPKNSWATGLFVIIVLINIFLGILVAVAGIKAVGQVVKNEKLDIKNTFSIGWKRYWKFLLLSILLAFIIGFGGILIIIPGIVFLVWYAFSKFILIEEKTGILIALGRSKNLVQGKFWRVFGRLFVFGVFSGLVSILVSLVPYVGSVITALAGPLFILPSYLLYKELSA